MSLHISQTNSIANGGETPLVLAHGFTQNTNCWASFSTEFEDTYRLKLVDMPGHGLSKHDQADLVTSGDLLVEAGGEANYVGYSMGGWIALHAALQHPSQVLKLVLIGVNPGVDTIAEQQERKIRDIALADKLQQDGLHRFLQDWLTNPLFKGLPDEAVCLTGRLTNRAAGLVATLENRSVGWQNPLWERLTELRMPVLLVAGQSDQKYRLSNERAAGLIPNAETCVIPGTHAVHLQHPKKVANIISHFIDV